MGTAMQESFGFPDGEAVLRTIFLQLVCRRKPLPISLSPMVKFRDQEGNAIPLPFLTSLDHNLRLKGFKQSGSQTLDKFGL